MGERGVRRGVGAGAPFYAPPRRKTSAEIISEARAAVYGGEIYYDFNGLYKRRRLVEFSFVIFLIYFCVLSYNFFL